MQTDHLANAYKTVRDATVENPYITRAEAIAVLNVILAEQVKDFEDTLQKEMKRG